MNYRQHLTFHGLFLLILLILFTKLEILLTFILNITDENIFILSGGIFLYFLGAILPDSDSNDKRSYIFKTVFFPIAYLVNLLEYPILLFTKRKRGHRQSLHTISGIIISSFVVTILISLILFLITSKDFPLVYAIFWFACLFLGQFLHLIEDKIWNPRWKIKFV